MKRAIAFYGEVFHEAKWLYRIFGDTQMAFFSWHESADGDGGALVDAEEHYDTKDEWKPCILFM